MKGTILTLKKKVTTSYSAAERVPSTITKLPMWVKAFSIHLNIPLIDAWQDSEISFAVGDFIQITGMDE